MLRFIIEIAAGSSRNFAGEKNVFKRITSQVDSDVWGLSRHEMSSNSQGGCRVSLLLKVA